MTCICLLPFIQRAKLFCFKGGYLILYGGDVCEAGFVIEDTDWRWLVCFLLQMREKKMCQRKENGMNALTPEGVSTSCSRGRQ